MGIVIFGGLIIGFFYLLLFNFRVLLYILGAILCVVACGIVGVFALGLLLSLISA